MTTLEVKALPKFDMEAFEKKVQAWLDNPNNSVEAMTSRVRAKASREAQLTQEGFQATTLPATPSEGTPEPTSGLLGPIQKHPEGKWYSYRNKWGETVNARQSGPGPWDTPSLPPYIGGNKGYYMDGTEIEDNSIDSKEEETTTKPIKTIMDF